MLFVDAGMRVDSSGRATSPLRRIFYARQSLRLSSAMDLSLRSQRSKIRGSSTAPVSPAGSYAERLAWFVG